jgi:MarR family transcriptional regulator, organic hydroperoxide resistance regulator
MANNGSISTHRIRSGEPGSYTTPVSRRLPSLLNQVVAALDEEAAPYFRSLGLSIPAARAMVGFYEGGGKMAVGKLAETTCIDLSTMSHILRRLEKQGLVTRKRDPEDNRIVYAALTKAGHRIAKQCHDASLRHEKFLLGDLSSEDTLRLKRLLTKVFANTQRSGNLQLSFR